MGRERVRDLGASDRHIKQFAGGRMPISGQREARSWGGTWPKQATGYRLQAAAGPGAECGEVEGRRQTPDSQIFAASRCEAVFRPSPANRHHEQQLSPIAGACAATSLPQLPEV